MERALKEAFNSARRLAPCCVLLDDMHLLCRARSSSEASEAQRRAVTCLLTLMDGLTDGGASGGGRDGGAPSREKQAGGVFVIGTTARIGDVDAAIRRAGRIDREVELSVPSALDREAVLRLLLGAAGIIHCDCDDPHTCDDIRCAHRRDLHHGQNADHDGANTQASSVVGGGRGVGEGGGDAEAVTPAVIREVAQQAHGMVGADLLQVVKEACSLTLARALRQQQQRRWRQVRQEPQHIIKNTLETGTKIGLEDKSDAAVESLASILEQECHIDSPPKPPHQSNPADVQPYSVPEVEEHSVRAMGAAADETSTTGGESEIEGRVAGRVTVAAWALRLAVRRVSPSALREMAVEVPAVRWTDIGGMDTVKRALREVRQTTPPPPPPPPPLLPSPPPIPRSSPAHPPPHAGHPCRQDFCDDWVVYIDSALVMYVF